MRQLFLTAEDSLRLAGLCTAASTDTSRPILTFVRMVFTNEGENLVLTASATDSYRAGRLRVVFGGQADTELPDEFMVSAKLLKGVLSKVGKRGRARFDLAGTELSVTAHTPSGDLTQVLKLEDGTFPRVDSLFEEARNGVQEDPVEGDSGFGFNPNFLASIPAILGFKPTLARGSSEAPYPIRVRLADTRTPAYFWVVTNQETSSEAILMPVRL